MNRSVVTEVVRDVVFELRAAGDLQGSGLVVDADEGFEFPDAERYQQWRDGPELPQGPFGWAVIRLPMGKAYQRMTAERVGAALQPGGVVLVAGANDEGAKSCKSWLTERFDGVENAQAKRHVRVWRAVRKADASEDAPLEGYGEWFTDTVAGRELRWRSYPGLFAHGRLDDATRLLLECLAMPRTIGDRILEFGCGSGVVLQFLSKASPSPELTGLDANSLAVHAARQSAPGATILHRDALPDTGRFTDIVSNPPLHQGKDNDRSVMHAMIDEARPRLVGSGSLWIVTQGAAAVRQPLEAAFKEVTIAKRTSRFVVWRAKRPKRGPSPTQ